MRMPFFSTCAIAATLCLAAMGAPSACAVTPPPVASRTAESEQPMQRLGAVSEADLLRQQYAILEVADHDYKGHRIKAMKAIAAACKVLGSPIAGDGKGREKQAISDAQLREVLGVLQQVRGSLAGSGQKKVLTHVDVAIRELKTALSIR